MSLLVVEQVTKRFGGLTALDCVELVVHAGELKGLIGPNGSGKTTLFNVVNGLYKPDGGSIYFKGENVSGRSMRSIAQRGVARTFQQVQLCYDMTALENATIGAHRVESKRLGARSRVGFYSDRRVLDRGIAALEFVNLSNYKETLARNLSYGHQRLLEIARAVAGEPELMLLDEPAAGLNIVEQFSLMELIQKISTRGIAILLVEHNMRVVMGCCKVLAVLNYGKKIAEGSPEEIRGNNEVVEAYLGTRTGRGRSANTHRSPEGSEKSESRVGIISDDVM